MIFTCGLYYIRGICMFVFWLERVLSHDVSVIFLYLSFPINVFLKPKPDHVHNVHKVLDSAAQSTSLWGPRAPKIRKRLPLKINPTPIMCPKNK